RGLEDPDDPRQAIPAAAQFLRHLHNRFGNLGLAAAAYNGGPNRVAGWLAGRTSLAHETENYVRIITRQPADHWRDIAAKVPDLTLSPNLEFRKACETLPALLKKEKPPQGAPVLPWGAQISAHFKQHIAVAAFERAKAKAPSAFAGGPLNVTRATVRTRGPRPIYRAALGAPSRQKAEDLCNAVRRSGGACIVVKH
ncbi:MAG: lytic transglycosylase domain-containing protein, partial [Pseudomonadota bacterium]